MGKDNDRPVFDASAADRSDRRRAFRFFMANFRDYCIMEDYVDSSKPVDSDDYWLTTKQLLKIPLCTPASFPSS